jgi:hypothetical protein
MALAAVEDRLESLDHVLPDGNSDMAHCLRPLSLCRAWDHNPKFLYLNIADAKPSDLGEPRTRGGQQKDQAAEVASFVQVESRCRECPDICGRQDLALPSLFGRGQSFRSNLHFVPDVVSKHAPVLIDCGVQGRAHR